MSKQEKLERLFNEVMFMRKHQKDYFSFKPGTAEKLNALKDSKRAEARVDNLIQEIQSNQTEIEL